MPHDLVLSRETKPNSTPTYIAHFPAEQTAWLAGARDSEVGKTLALMHRNPAEPWTIASLAKEAGLSRSVLAERFRHYLNEPPMAYLTRWRLQLGGADACFDQLFGGTDRIRSGL